MGFQVSPGVQVNEINATNVIPAVSTSIGAFVGEFNWGPVNEIITVGSENELGSIFGTPSKTNSKYFLTAAGFLKYGNNLKTVRSVGAAAKNAVTGSVAVAINNKDAYDSATIAATAGNWIARCPGALGNAIAVHTCHAAAGTTFSSWDYKAQFDAAPGTSDFAIDNGKAATFYDEVHVAVVDATGAITGSAGTVLEVYPFLSIASDAKDSSGSSIYYADVINTKSEYVFFGNHDTNGTGGPATTLASGGVIVGSAATVVETTMAEHIDDGNTSDSVVASVMTLGVDAAPIAADVVLSYDLFADSETTDISLLFSYPDASGAATIAQKLATIASDRKDCMAHVAPPIANGDTAANALTWYESIFNTSTSYAAGVGVNAQVYDKYNDQFVWIGLAGHIAGLCAGTDESSDPWFSPAGYTRGQLFGITKLAYNANQANRDDLYKASINPVVSFPGEGTVLYGDKTLMKKPNAFDRINVRRLFIVLEKAIATAAKYQLFEFNDEFTRAMFKNMTEPFLRDVKGRRGVTDFLVKCDEENNNGNIVDTNQFVADIYIKPARSINFIQLNFIATRTGVDFTEIAG